MNRVMIAGTGSGCGKTTMTMAFLAACFRSSLRPVPFKCGPDYIDPRFHEMVTGRTCRNLDLLLMGEEGVRRTLQTHGAAGDVAVVEGVMGYYDGVGPEGFASAHELSQKTTTPVLLVVSVRGKALSLCAEVQGFLRFQPNLIAGVLLNHCPKGMTQYYRDLLWQRLKVPVYGYLPPTPELTLPSRHLGLVQAEEIEELQEIIERLGATAQETLDLEGILALAQREDLPIAPRADALRPGSFQGLNLAVSKDEAFCFYYEENLELLQEAGVALTYFSPLRARGLPSEADGVILWGGYPELHAEAFSKNEPMHRALKEAAKDGMPIYAECGGYMALHESLVNFEGEHWPMAGVFPGEAKMTPRLQNFGYCQLTARADNLLCRSGESLAAHSFHHSVSSELSDVFEAHKLSGAGDYRSHRATQRVLAGYPHVHFAGCPQAAARFLTYCRTYHKERTHGLD